MSSYNAAEPGDIETLDLRVANPKEWYEVEYIRCGVIDEDVARTGRVSFVMVQFRGEPEYGVKVCQSFISTQEIDIIIEGLQEAKRRIAEILDPNGKPPA